MNSVSTSIKGTEGPSAWPPDHADMFAVTLHGRRVLCTMPGGQANEVCTLEDNEVLLDKMSASPEYSCVFFAVQTKYDTRIKSCFTGETVMSLGCRVGEFALGQTTCAWMTEEGVVVSRIRNSPDPRLLVQSTNEIRMQYTKFDQLVLLESRMTPHREPVVVVYDVADDIMSLAPVLSPARFYDETIPLGPIHCSTNGDLAFVCSTNTDVGVAFCNIYSSTSILFAKIQSEVIATGSMVVINKSTAVVLNNQTICVLYSKIEPSFEESKTLCVFAGNNIVRVQCDAGSQIGTTEDSMSCVLVQPQSPITLVQPIFDDKSPKMSAEGCRFLLASLGKCLVCRRLTAHAQITKRGCLSCSSKTPKAVAFNKAAMYAWRKYQKSDETARSMCVMWKENPACSYSGKRYTEATLVFSKINQDAPFLPENVVILEQKFARKKLSKATKKRAEATALRIRSKVALGQLV